MARLVALLLLLSLLSAPVLAAPDAEEKSGLPQLDEHRFVPVLALTEPFITTHLQMGVVLGWTLNAVQPLYSPADSAVIGSIESDQLLTGIAAVYQQRVTDWLAARVRLDVIGRLGTDTSSLVNDGITGSLAYDIGWLLRAYQTRSVLVSGSVSLRSAQGTFINIADYVEDVLAGEDASLVRGRNSLSGLGGAHAAWGINQRFGLLGTLTAGYGESFDGRGENEWFGDVRAAVSYDAGQDLKVPVGFALTGGYSGRNLSSDNDKGTAFWNLRISGQGRADFTAGLEIQNTYVEVSSQPETVEFLEIKIDMRYYY